MPAKVLKAVILETPSADNGYRYLVEEVPATNNGIHYLSGPGAPKGAKEGDRGTLTYTATGSMGYWAWKAV